MYIYIYELHMFRIMNLNVIVIFKEKTICFSPTAESFGVSAQIGSGVVRGGPEVRFHEGSTRVPPGVPRGSARAAGWCEH